MKIYDLAYWKEKCFALNGIVHFVFFLVAICFLSWFAIFRFGSLQSQPKHSSIEPSSSNDTMPPKPAICRHATSWPG